MAACTARPMAVVRDERTAPVLRQRSPLRRPVHYVRGVVRQGLPARWRMDSQKAHGPRRKPADFPGRHLMMDTLDLTTSRFGVGHMPTDLALLLAHVENHATRYGTSPEQVAITARQYATLMPFLTPPAETLLGIRITIDP